MNYEVLLTHDAMQDLTGIHDYIFDHDSPERADYVLTRIEETFNTLSYFPERGGYPAELLEVGNRDYREIHFKPYRIIYRIEKDVVYVYVIADARRNLKQLLLRRLV